MWTNAATYLAELAEALRLLDVPTIERFSDRLFRAYLAGRTVFCLGNGGSAAAASHLATDLSKLTTRPGQTRLKALALVDSVPTLTATGNDFSFDEVFVEQLRTFMAPSDVVIGISTSGRSVNVLNAIEYANAHGGVTIGISGADDSPLRDLARDSLSIASLSVQHVEDVTLVAAHLLCLLTRQKCWAEARPISRERVEDLVAIDAQPLGLDMSRHS